MKQYCRYCCLASEYDDALVCTANAPCGNSGCGKLYDMQKAKRLNKCAYFEFNPNDLLRQDEHGNFMQYKPNTQKKIKDLGLFQLSINSEVKLI